MKIIKSFLSVKKEEAPIVVNMFIQFFCIITAFWIFKPLKKTLFIQFYDKAPLSLLGMEFGAAQAELLAKILNLFVAIFALAVFSFLSRRFKREKLSYILTSLMLGGITIFSLALNNPGTISVWTFYLFGDMYNTVLVTTFFAFLNDIVTPEQSRRLYGPILLGGIVGGVVGTNVLRAQLKTFTLSEWMIPCLVLTFVIIITSFFTGKYAQDVPAHHKGQGEAHIHFSKYLKELLSKKYLLGIMAMVGLYEMVSTVVDFQFSSVVSYFLDGAAIGEHFTTVYAIITWLSLIVQIFLTGILLANFGVGSAISVLPIAILGTSVFYLIFPILWIASLMPIFDNSLSYSIYQSAKESLYVPLKQEEKYQAKAFIDIFIMRGAKVLSIGLSLLISTFFASFEGIRWISILAIVLILLWLFVIRFVVKEYNKKTGTVKALQ